MACNLYDIKRRIEGGECMTVLYHRLHGEEVPNLCQLPVNLRDGEFECYLDLVDLTNLEGSVWTELDPPHLMADPFIFCTCSACGMVEGIPQDSPWSDFGSFNSLYEDGQRAVVCGDCGSKNINVDIDEGTEDDGDRIFVLFKTSMCVEWFHDDAWDGFLDSYRRSGENTPYIKYQQLDTLKRDFPDVIDVKKGHY